MSSPVVFKVYPGETLDLALSYLNPDHSPVASLDTANATLRLATGDTATGSIDPQTGQISFSVPPETTSQWPRTGVSYQVWLDWADGRVKVVLTGSIDVQDALP